MRLLIHEIRKILTWKMMLLLILVNGILYFLMIEFHIANFPNGRPALDSYRIGIEMVEKYGTKMTEEDYIDFKKSYDAQIQEANQYLQAHKEFVDLGITTYEDFLNMNLENEKESSLHYKIMFEESVNIFWELQERSRLIGFHDVKEKRLEDYKALATSEQKARIDELIDKGHYQVYPEVVIMNFNEFILSVTIAIIVSVILVTSPVMIKDRLQQMVDLQYSTKKGRDLYKSKLFAGLISSFLVISALLLTYFRLYSLNDTEMYFEVPIHMFIGPFYWYDLTFFQYILLCVIAIYLLGLAFTLLALSFSSIMPNYVTLIGIQVPIFVAMIAYGLHYFIRQIVHLDVPQWAIPTCYLILIAISALFIIRMWKKEKNRDIVAG